MRVIFIGQSERKTRLLDPARREGGLALRKIILASDLVELSPSGRPGDLDIAQSETRDPHRRKQNDRANQVESEGRSGIVGDRPAPQGADVSGIDTASPAGAGPGQCRTNAPEAADLRPLRARFAVGFE